MTSSSVYQRQVFTMVQLTTYTLRMSHLASTDSLSHPTVTRDRVEVEVTVKIVLGPPHLQCQGLPG